MFSIRMPVLTFSLREAVVANVRAANWVPVDWSKYDVIFLLVIASLIFFCRRQKLTIYGFNLNVVKKYLGIAVTWCSSFWAIICKFLCIYTIKVIWQIETRTQKRLKESCKCNLFLLYPKRSVVTFVEFNKFVELIISITQWASNWTAGVIRTSADGLCESHITYSNWGKYRLLKKAFYKLLLLTMYCHPKCYE